MEKYVSLLAQTSLFSGFEEETLCRLLRALAPVKRSYEKDEVLLLAGYETRELGIVLEGSITAVKSTPAGVQLTIACMGAGGIFGDVLGGSTAKSPVTVTAVQDCTVLWFSVPKMLSGCCGVCATHTHLLQNLVTLITDKYFALDRRVDVLMLKSVREKVLYYLQNEAVPQADGRIAVPFTRAAWAEHLGCERSALCRELSRMQQDGVLQIERRNITLCG